MKRFFSLMTVLSLFIILFPVTGKAASNSPAPDKNLFDSLTANVAYLGSQNQKSFFDVLISDVSEDIKGLPGIHAGWCIQNNIFGDLHGDRAILYDSTSSNLPADVRGLPWHEINYLLNNKIRGANRSDTEFVNDVQGAIWMLLGSQDIAPEYDTEFARQMVAAAQANTGYIPGPGEKVAVIIYTDGMDASNPNSFQEAIIEVPLTGCSLCEPLVVTADFTKDYSSENEIPVGGSVEGMGRVAQDLNIQANYVDDMGKVGDGDVLRIMEGSEDPYIAYSSPLNGHGINNFGIDPERGGFTDMSVVPKDHVYPDVLVRENLYTFTFSEGVMITDFKLRMLDFGDYNPHRHKNHFAVMTAYDENDIVVAQDRLSYTTTTAHPFSLLSNVSEYGRLNHGSGDAAYATADPRQPGNWLWHVSGYGIVKVVLEFGPGYDPNIGFDNLSYTKCLNKTGWTRRAIAADFTWDDISNHEIQVNESVQGLNKVAQGLNILAAGDARRIQQGSLPFAYSSPIPKGGGTNYGIDPERGGFTDIAAVENYAHQYTFTFEFPAGVSVTNFSLHMLDFGDYDLAPLQTEHSAQIIAYDRDGIIVDTLNYTTAGQYFSPLFGPLRSGSGDAMFALPGQPGNWTWAVSSPPELEGPGIKTIELIFDPTTGFDPNIAFDDLRFVIEECTIE